MKKQIRLLGILSFVFIFAFALNAGATLFYEIPSSFEYYSSAQLDLSDSDDDYYWADNYLGFNVTIFDKTYDRFGIDSNGYVQLLGSGDTENEYGYGSAANLIADNPDGTYLMAGYDDLSSDYYGYYGYKLEANRAIFFWNTETYDDGDWDLLNEMEIILYDTGRIEWHYGSNYYEGYDYDLFSGAYIGNKGTLFELTSNNIPYLKSYSFPAPEPSTFILLGLGLLGAVGLRKKMK